MPDREKVIKGLEICSDCGFCESIKKFDLRCPYRNNDGKGCDRSQLLMDALSLLKEQEAVVRCKDCKAWKQYDDMNLGECELYPEYNKMGDWFCNFGERKEGR